MRSFRLLASFVALLLLGSSLNPTFAQKAPADPGTKWAKEMDRLREQDRASPPEKGGVIFVGSSSIRLWKLDESFPGQKFVNHGFGGSQIVDSTHFAEQLVTAHQPSVVVFYAGDNDLASGKSPEKVAADFRQFVTKVHRATPTTRILYLSIKASVARWKNVENIRAANALIQRAVDGDSRLEYIDVFTPMLGADGQPREELLAKDKLHLSPAGYELWTSLVKPRIDAARNVAADVILHNGRIVTVNPTFAIAEAVAIRGDRLLAVGTNADVLKLKRDTTRVVDLQGKMALPGLIDSHVHPSGAAMHEFDHPVPDMESVVDVLAYVKSRVVAVPEGTPIWVNQIFITRLKEQRFPTRAELDAVAPKHPVVFSTGPDGMANSLALKLSGIDKDFQVTGAGIIEKDAQTGELTGMLRGGTKRYLKLKSPPSTATDADRDRRLLELFRDYNANGITCIADRNASRDAVEQYQRLRRDGKLTTRVAISHAVTVDGASTTESIREKIAEVAKHPLCQGDSLARIVGVKSFLDGGMLTGSAFMRQPWGVSSIYGITDPEYRGVRFIPAEPLQTVVRACVEQRLQFTAHSVGDGAVHALLDTYEEVNKTLPIRDTRPCLTHSNFMSREAVEQMVRLGVVADIQPAWLYLDTRTLTAQFGYDRLRYFQPLKTIFELGGVAGGGSDHMQKIGALRGINPYHPFLGLQTTITRRAKWHDGQLHPEEALSRQQAIRFYTWNNAYLVFLEDQIGSLEPGKLADLILLDQDILTCPEENIRNTKVVATYLGGKLLQ